MNKLISKDLLNEDYIKWYGRYHYDEDTNRNYIYNAVSGFMIKTNASKLSIKIYAHNCSTKENVPFVGIVINQDFNNVKRFKLDKENNQIDISLDGKNNYIELYKQSESQYNHIGIEEINVDKELLKLDYKFNHEALVVGDSTIAAYGVHGKLGETFSTEASDGMKDFSFIALKNFNSCIHTFCTSGWGMAMSRWTNPQDTNIPFYKDKVATLTDIPWDDKKINPEIIVISLGSNDMSLIRMDESLKETRVKTFVKAYNDFIDYEKGLHPNAAIFMIYGPINDKDMYPMVISSYDEAKKRYNDIYLIKLTGDTSAIAGHPCEAAHANMAKELTEEIKTILHW